MTSKLPITLRVNREGSFVAHADAEHPTQCGATSTREYRYLVTIEASNKALTSEGFVIEIVSVDHYFQDCYGEDGSQKLKCDSCENMAQRAIEHFVKEFETNDELKSVELQRIFIRIHGSPFSFVEAEWKAKIV